MSLVNDALNKIQKQRGQKLSMDELSRYGASPQPVPERKAGLPPAFWVAVNATVLVAVLVSYHFFTTRAATTTAASSEPISHESLPTPVASRQDSESRPAVVAKPRMKAPSLTPAPTANRASDTNTNLSTRSTPDAVVTPAPMTSSPSPFTSSPSSTNENLSTDSDYDLAGMTVVGKSTLLSIIRRSDQRSIWVPVGKTVGEVTAVSYNADADNAVIQVRGQQFTIGMRNGSVYFNPVSPQK